jgi:hypothetical protein
LQRQEGDTFFFATAQGREVRFDLRAEAGRSISRCDIRTGAAGVKVARGSAGDFFDVEVRLADGRVYRHLMPAGSNETLNLMTDEIGQGSRHRVYLKALAAMRELL